MLDLGGKYFTIAHPVGVHRCFFCKCFWCHFSRPGGQRDERVVGTTLLKTKEGRWKQSLQHGVRMERRPEVSYCVYIYIYWIYV